MLIYPWHVVIGSKPIVLWFKQRIKYDNLLLSDTFISSPVFIKKKKKKKTFRKDLHLASALMETFLPSNRTDKQNLNKIFCVEVWETLAYILLTETSLQEVEWRGRMACSGRIWSVSPISENHNWAQTSHRFHTSMCFFLCPLYF